MAEKVDPEDVRDVLNLYFQPRREAVGRHGGRAEKFIGDAVMAVFGVPVATETDPHRAIRAVLEERDGLQGLNQIVESRHGVRLAVRVGIHTGTALVDGTAVPILRTQQVARPAFAVPGGADSGFPTAVWESETESVSLAHGPRLAVFIFMGSLLLGALASLGSNLAA